MNRYEPLNDTNNFPSSAERCAAYLFALVIVFTATPKLVQGQSVNGITATINIKAIFNLTERKESPLFVGNF